MKIRHSALLAAAAAALGIGAAAQAQDAGPREEVDVFFSLRPHPKMDANGDGQVTREEFMAPHAQLFGRLDADRDGRLSQAELKGDMDRDVLFLERDSPGGPGVHKEFRILRRGGEDEDKNKDGKISFEEFAANLREFREHEPPAAPGEQAIRQAFDKADRNRSGFLEPDERKEPIRIIHEERKPGP